MRVTKSPAAAEQMFKNLISMIRECKKCLDIENKLFDKIGIESLMKGQEKVTPMLLEFHEYYIDATNIRDLKNTVPENTLKTAAAEYDEFQKTLKQYQINLEIAGKVSDIFLNTIKKSIKTDAKKDYGYNKDGTLVSDKKILSSMPSISVNNKV